MSFNKTALLTCTNLYHLTMLYIGLYCIRLYDVKHFIETETRQKLSIDRIIKYYEDG